MERLKPTDHLRRARDIGRVLLSAAADRLDTHYADRLNPPEDYQRIDIAVVETPCATEAELDAS